jgi:hypothetical protein
VLSRLDKDARERLEGGKDRPQAGPDVKVETGTGARMFFRLSNGQVISQCITKIPPEEEKVKGALRDLWDRGPEVFNAASWEEVPYLLWTMYILPVVVILTAVLLMLLSGRWIAALGLGGALIVIEVGVFLLIWFTTPAQLFQPSAYGVLLVVPPLIALVASGILLVAERYFWVLGIVAATVVYLVLLIALYLLFPSIDWPPMKVDFTWVLILIGLLLSAEWFMRKMLRLA